MKLETLLELKKAGFPFSFEGKDDYEWTGELIYDPENNEWLKVPSLEELIEACGDRFDNLVKLYPQDKSAKAPRDSNNVRISGGWECSSKEDETYTWEYGSTPSEAVANLWLSLNKKDKE